MNTPIGKLQWGRAKFAYDKKDDLSFRTNLHEYQVYITIPFCFIDKYQCNSAGKELADRLVHAVKNILHYYDLPTKATDSISLHVPVPTPGPLEDGCCVIYSTEADLSEIVRWSEYNRERDKQ